MRIHFCAKLIRIPHHAPSKNPARSILDLESKGVVYNDSILATHIEFETLSHVLTENDAVVSLGGGAPVSDQAQAAISQSASHVVFLDVSLATAAPRVGFNRDRPLLLGNPRAQWQSLSDNRRPIYERLADVTIKVDDMDVPAIVDAIAKSAP